MRKVFSYCDMCSAPMSADLRDNLACETQLQITAPFPIRKWGRAETVTSKFSVCRVCEGRVKGELAVVAKRHREDWLRVVNANGLGKEFRDV